MSDIGAISSGRWHRTHDRLKIGAMSFENVTCRFGAAVCAPAGTGCKARPNKNAGRTHLPELKQPATFIVILLSNPAEAGFHTCGVRRQPGVWLSNVESCAPPKALSTAKAPEITCFWAVLSLLMG